MNPCKTCMFWTINYVFIPSLRQCKNGHTIVDLHCCLNSFANHHLIQREFVQEIKQQCTVTCHFYTAEELGSKHDLILRICFAWILDSLWHPSHLINYFTWSNKTIKKQITIKINTQITINTASCFLRIEDTSASFRYIATCL